jgi:hypothetical protein
MTVTRRRMPPFVLVAFALAGCQALLGIDPDRAVEPAAIEAADASPGQPRDASGPIEDAIGEVAVADGRARDAATVDGNAAHDDAGDGAAAGPRETGAPPVDAADATPAPRVDFGTACHPDDPFDPPQPVAELNTATAAELHARLSADGTRIYFSRGEGDPAQLMVAHRAPSHDRFDPPTPLSIVTPQLPAKDRSPTLVADEGMLFFDSVQSQRRIWVAPRSPSGDGFGEPRALMLFEGNQDELYPYVLPDGSALYFTTASHTRHSGVEPLLYVWRVALSGGQAVGEPASVRPTFGPLEQQSAVVSADERIMYFASDDGLRHQVISVATRATATERFTMARPVLEIDGRTRDLPSFLTADACALYFVRETTLNGNDFDIYVARKTPRR